MIFSVFITMFIGMIITSTISRVAPTQVVTASIQGATTNNKVLPLKPN
jgi:hypothetical protein